MIWDPKRFNFLRIGIIIDILKKGKSIKYIMRFIPFWDILKNHQHSFSIGSFLFDFNELTQFFKA